MSGKQKTTWVLKKANRKSRPQYCPLDYMRPPYSSTWSCHELEEVEKHLLSSTSTCHHPPLKDLVLTKTLAGSTPLLMACEAGQLESVKRIVDSWGVDINTAADFYSSRKFEGVTPLYVAARCSRVEIVKFLIEKGANIAPNIAARACENFTPLHAAMNGLQYLERDDLRKRISLVRILLEAGADPSDLPARHYRDTWCPASNVTALHYWLSRGFSSHIHDDDSMESLAIVQLLVEKGADLLARDNIGFTPMLRAAVTSAVPSMSTKVIYPPNSLVFNALLNKNNIRRLEKIYALELAGAVFLEFWNHHNNYAFLGFECWRRALALRVMDTDGCHPIHKNIPTPHNARIIEWKTLGELEDLEQRPEEYEIQSLLVRFRILSNLSWDAVEQHFWEKMEDFCIFHEDNTLRDRLIPSLSLSWTILEKISSGNFKPDEVEGRVCEIVHLLVRIHSLSVIGRPILSSHTLKTTLDLIMATCCTLSRSPANSNLTEIFPCGVGLIYYFYDFIALLCSSRFQEFLNEEIIQSLRTFVSRDFRGINGSSFLHHACKMGDPLRHVRLFLHLGMDPNLVDNNKNTPLHILAQNYRGVDTDTTARLLVEHEAHPAHLDLVNNEGMTVADIFKKNREQQQLNNNVVHDIPDWCLNKSVTKLKCLCARIIRSAKVPYKDDCECPRHLYPFIALH